MIGELWEKAPEEVKDALLGAFASSDPECCVHSWPERGPAAVLIEAFTGAAWPQFGWLVHTKTHGCVISYENDRWKASGGLLGSSIADGEQMAVGEVRVWLAGRGAEAGQ